VQFLQKSLGKRLEAWVLVAIFGVALAVRLPGMGRALNHDEAYTWEVFADKPYAEIVTSYPVPNNHILHSLLVRLAVQLCGEYEWVIRLPALLAGLLAIPAAFFLCRAFFGEGRAGLVAAGLLALIPAHITYSQMARGYSLLVLFSLLSLLSIWMALAGRSGWWLGFAGSGFLGAYAVPSAAFHLAALLLWAVLICVRRRDWRMLARAFFAGGGLALCLGLAYWPIRAELLRAGSRWGVDVSGDPFRLLEVFGEATALCAGGKWGILPGLMALLGLGVAARSRQWLAGYAVLAWTVPFFLAWSAGIAGQSRTYLFLLVPFVALAACGAVEGVRQVRIQLPILLVIAVGYGWPAIQPRGGAGDRGFKEVGDYLMESILPGDLMVVPFIMDMQISHYGSQAIHRGMTGIFRKGTVGRLLLVTKQGDPRFRLDNYLLKFNLTLDEEDYQRNLPLPVASFVELYAAGGVAVNWLASSGQRLFSGEGEDWKVLRLVGEGGVELGRVEPAWSSRPGLRLESRSGGKFVLQSSRTFTTPGKGLLVLTWARTERAQVSPSLYQVVEGEKGVERLPLQMFCTNYPVETEGADGKKWYLEAFILPVQEEDRFGVYIMAWDAEPLQIAEVGCFFFPYAR
jgi:hypothetical protein